MVCINIQKYIDYLQKGFFTLYKPWINVDIIECLRVDSIFSYLTHIRDENIPVSLSDVINIPILLTFEYRHIGVSTASPQTTRPSITPATSLYFIQ